MWEINLADQIRSGLQSIPLGIMLAVFFYTLESISIVLKATKVRIFITDILFFVISAFVTFCFLIISSNGEVRGYILLGEGIGFFLFKAFFSKHYLRVLTGVLGVVRSVFDSLSRLSDAFFEKNAEGVRKSLEKLKNNKKKGLKNQE